MGRGHGAGARASSRSAGLPVLCVGVVLALAWGCAPAGSPPSGSADASSGTEEARSRPSPSPAAGGSASSAPSAHDDATPPAPKRAAAGSTDCPATRGEAVLELVNRERARAGLGPLAVDRRLVEAARAHARDMARSGLTGHVGSDGSEPPQRVHRAGYQFGRVGENVAAGVPTAADVMAGWMASEHHRDNILSSGYDDIGVAFVDVAGSEYGTYWVQVFGSLLDPDGGEYRVACNP